METHSTRVPTAHADTPEQSAIPTLKNLRINGVSPFGSSGDGVDERLEEAHALLLVIAAGFDADEECGRIGIESSLTNLRSGIVSKALGGLATLLALAQHHNDAATAERCARAGERSGS